MDHRPFEDWLLADQPLTGEQKRALDAHLRTCVSCMSIAEVNLALRKARTAAPVAGFSRRWQTRLAAERKLQRRRQAVGMTILSLAGAGLLVGVSAPLMLAFLASPAEWIIKGLEYLLFVVTSIEAAVEASRIMINVLPDFIPPYVWMVILSALAGFSLLGTVSLWRVSRLPQKA